MAYLPYVLIALAAICNANMDIVTDHFSTSIYKNLNPLFFNHEKGSLGKKVGGYYIDMWHLSKSAMLTFICAAVALSGNLSLLQSAKSFALCSVTWVVTFNIFYNYVLRRK